MTSGVLSALLVPPGETAAARLRAGVTDFWDAKEAPAIAIVTPTVGQGKQVITYTVTGTPLADAVQLVKYARSMGVDPSAATFPLLSQTTLVGKMGMQMAYILREAVNGVAHQRNVMQVIRAREHDELRDLRLQEFTLRSRWNGEAGKAPSTTVLYPESVAEILANAPKVYALHSTTRMNRGEIMRWLLAHRDCGSTFREAGIHDDTEGRANDAGDG